MTGSQTDETQAGGTQPRDADRRDASERVQGTWTGRRRTAAALSRRLAAGQLPVCRVHGSGQRAEVPRHHRPTGRAGGRGGARSGGQRAWSRTPPTSTGRSSPARGWPGMRSTATATATGGPRTTRNSGRPRTDLAARRAARGELAARTWPSPRNGSAPWPRSCAWGSCCCTTCPPNPARCSRSPRASGTCGETNYGALFDVRVEPAPGNLAFTSREILPHTDNPYRDPVPTVQLLHCLRAAGDGGDTGLVDGFAAARACASPTGAPSTC